MNVGVLGEIWLVAMPLLITKEDGTFDTAFQIRPFLIVDEGKGILVEENEDYLASKITTQQNHTCRIKEIDNWQTLGLKEKSYIRIEIPERIEQAQLIRKICKMPLDQFLDFYKEILGIFNIQAMKEFIEKEETAKQ